MIFKLISKFVLGGGVEAITKNIRQMRQDSLNAKNAENRIKLEEAVAKLENQRAVLVAEAKGNWNVFVRSLFAIPFIVFLWKVIIWDKVLKLGTTDNLSPDLWNIMMVVMGFYFLYETATVFRKK